MFSFRVNVSIKGFYKKWSLIQMVQCTWNKSYVFIFSISVCNRNIPDYRLPHIQAWILSWRQHKLPVLSNIKAATAKQNNRLITEEERRGGLFSHRPDLFFWRVTLRLYRTRLLCIQKVRKINQNPHIWLARFITAKRVKVLAVIRFSTPPLQI